MPCLGWWNRVLATVTGAAARAAVGAADRAGGSGRTPDRPGAGAGLRVLRPGCSTLAAAAKRLPCGARVVEFGGRRTLWLQEYGAEVVVVEHARAAGADRLPDETVDLAVVHGPDQVLCGLDVVPKVKRGGMLLLDRPLGTGYRALAEALREWERSDLLGFDGPATLWTKPA